MQAAHHPLLAAHLANARLLEARADWPGATLAYEAALAMAPDLAEAQYNRANLLCRAGRTEEALAGFDRAIALRPAWASAHLNRGALLAGSGKWNAAIACYRIATRLAPEEAAGWGNLGNALSALGQHEQAIAALQTATRLQPDGAIGFFNLGAALSAAGRIAEAAKALMRAVTIDPSFSAASVNLSSRLRLLGQPEAARAAAMLAVQAAPSLPQAWVALGNAWLDLGGFAEAVAAFRQALERHAFYPPAFVNLALALAAAGALHEALAVNEAAIKLAPGMAEPRLGRATTLLALGDFAQGWPAYEARWAMPGTSERPFPQRRWTGATHPGGTILLHAEQGLGDTLQFIRFAPLVAARSGARVILQVQQPLLRLCQSLNGLARVIPLGGASPAFDLHCPLMSLAGIFAPSLADLSPAAPYVMAEAGLVAARRLPPAQGKKRVGLVWAGQARPDIPQAAAMDRRRSLNLAAFAPLAALCRAGQITLVSLQMGAPAEQIRHPPDGLAIIEALAGVTNFAETAAVVAQLDLVIAVDTSVAHLAGAMGKPVWLLSRFDACWRWMRHREDSPWYPSMRIFRQATPNVWDDVIARIAAELALT